MAVNTGYSPEGMMLKEEHIKMQRDMLVLSGRFNQMDLSFDSQFLDDEAISRFVWSQMVVNISMSKSS